MPDVVRSTDDARVVNNTMRHQYRVLSDLEKQIVGEIKDAGAHFLELLHGIGGTDARSGRMGSRELSIAQTKLEEAVMWAVKSVTK